MTNKDFFSDQGTVIELISGKKFRVKCDNGIIITADKAARFRTKQGRRKAKIGIKDRVMVEIILGDLEKGQIVSLIESEEKNV